MNNIKFGIVHATEEQFQSEGYMEVQLKLMDNSTISYTADILTRVGQLKEFVAEKTGMDARRVELFHKNRRLHTMQCVMDKCEGDVPLMVGYNISGGGAAGKRRKAKQHSDTAPTSRVGVLGGWLRALALPVLGLGL